MQSLEDVVNDVEWMFGECRMEEWHRQDSHDPCTERYDTMQSSRLLSWLSVQYAAIAGKEPGTKFHASHDIVCFSLLLMPLPPLHQPNDHMMRSLY